MTILEIEILTHYFAIAVDFREGDFSAPAVREAIDRFTGPLGLLEPFKDGGPRNIGDPLRSYQITERGRVYVEALRDVPLPVQVWIMPTKVA